MGNKHRSPVGKANPQLDLFMGYHSFKSEDGVEYGAFEVYWFDDGQVDGWFWHACFPGCLPDGEAMGPFMSSRAAFKDAREED